jgi:hypothetical protein
MFTKEMIKMNAISYKMSKHAEQRQGQRGIRELEIQLTLIFGEIEYAPGSLSSYTLTKKKITAIQNSLNRVKNGLKIIESPDNIVTLYKLNQK